MTESDEQVFAKTEELKRVVLDSQGENGWPMACGVMEAVLAAVAADSPEASAVVHRVLDQMLERTGRVPRH